MKREKLVSALRQIENLVADCLAAIDESPSPTAQPKKAKPNGVSEQRTAIPDLAMPLRPFVNKHARKMSGPEKFTLVLAHMTKGKTGVKVEGAVITKAWAKMTGLLKCDFNTAYPTRAKDKGWVDSPRHNSYSLLPGWTEILRAQK
jgi:CHASE2 domain-containing sensor protein